MESFTSYVGLGAKCALIALILTVLIYVGLQVYEGQTGKSFTKKEKMIWLLAAWYSITLALVVFGRDEVDRLAPMSKWNLHLFNSLYEALSSQDKSSLWQLVFNTCVFIPAGALIFLAADRFEKKLLILAAALLLPALIETAQFFTGVGIFDVDDLLANFAGELWGYWIGKAAVFLLEKRENRILPLVAVLAPVLMLVFVLLYIELRPYGFLRADFINEKFTHPETVILDSTGFSFPEKVCYYKVNGYDKSDTDSTADIIFESVGCRRNMTMKDAYDTVCVYWAERSNTYVWLYYDGTFNLEIPNGLAIKGDIPTEIFNIVKNIFPDLNSTEYAVDKTRLSVSSLTNAGESLIGDVEWFFNGDGEVETISSHIRRTTVIEANACGESELEARLLRGEFQYILYPEDTGFRALECTIQGIDHVKDSKGVLRPVYIIDCEANNENFQVAVSAIK